MVYGPLLSQPFLPVPSNILHGDGDVAFDSSGTLHTIQHYNFGTDGRLVYATGSAEGAYQVDGTLARGWEVVAGHPGIAVDATGTPHVVYTTLWPSYRLNYATRDAPGWRVQTIDGSGKRYGYMGTFPKVIIDKGGIVHVLYGDGLHGQLKHARFVNQQWQIEVIDTIGTQAAYGAQVGALSAKMDANGGIGVAYWDGGNGLFKYAYLAAAALPSN